ncbi:hypothetical protein [Aquimarina aggregata]|uniref:hypothetical protein n=1 Tax=Aquimarina aggregata TaxID=1642818 RepID=UPI0024926797|nr:hypothetical protein [Aquimarina aggregata]
MKSTSFITIRILRYLVLFFWFTFMHCSCKQKSEHTSIHKTIDPLEGVWKQTNFYRLSNSDTIISDSTKVQHKIYLDGYVMWTSNATIDSLEWHGYGTYTYKSDTLTETLTSMSIPLRAYTNIYPIKIDLSKEDVLKQIIQYKNNDTIYQNIELYRRLK